MATCPGFANALPWPFPTIQLPIWLGLTPADAPDKKPPAPPAPPGDGAASPAGPRVSIELFVSPESPTSSAALRNIERALVGVQRDLVRLEICDVSTDPGRAAEAHVCFTPTLVIRAADQPPIWIFGALTDAEVLSEHLEVAGLQTPARGD
jgi:KaiB-like protein